MSVETTYRALALALLEAAEDSGNLFHLNSSMLRHLGEYDAMALSLLLPHMLCVTAERSGASPRGLAEEMFKRAPTDDYWYRELRDGMESIADELQEDED